MQYRICCHWLRRAGSYDIEASEPNFVDDDHTDGIVDTRKDCTRGSIANKRPVAEAPKAFIGDVVFCCVSNGRDNF